MYQLVFSKKVEKTLANFQRTNSRLFSQFIEALGKIEENPYCAKTLTGNLKGYYSYRVKDYRILFEIEKHLLLVYIEKIEHRKEVYR